MSGEVIKAGTLPINYEKATKAIAECSRIDECQDWANKAAAMSSYAKQANDETLHRHADRIKARAIQRLGELSSAIEKRQGKRNGAGLIRGAPNKLEVLKANGVSRDQAYQAEAVARIPRAEFDAQIESDHPPTITALAVQGKRLAPFEIGKPDEFKGATKALAMLRHFAEFAMANDPNMIARGVAECEREPAQRFIARINTWLDAFTHSIGDSNEEAPKRTQD